VRWQKKQRLLQLRKESLNLGYTIAIGCLGFNGILSYEITSMLSRYDASFYWPILPHLILVSLCIVSLIADYRIKNSWSLVVSLFMVNALFLTYWFAINRWSGGDDGFRSVWGFLVGGVTLCSVSVGSLFLMLGHRARTEWPNP
jgi:hypothetical protein